MSKSTKSYQLWMCKYCGRYDVTESSGSFPQHSENCEYHENRNGYIGPHHWVRQGKVDYSRYQEITAEWERTRAIWEREAERKREQEKMARFGIFSFVYYTIKKLF